MTKQTEQAKASALAELWRANPDKSNMATLGAAMLGGKWTGRHDAEALGVSTSVVGQAVAKLRTAGYNVETQPAGPNGLTAYRVGGEAATSNGHGPTPTHPPVGAKVTVRAVALGARGALVVHLSDGNGNAWAATITGYVDA
jgi:hypothetical protein